VVAALGEAIAAGAAAGVAIARGSGLDLRTALGRRILRAIAYRLVPDAALRDQVGGPARLAAAIPRSSHHRIHATRGGSPLLGASRC
jgi:hypothetical protein